MLSNSLTTLHNERYDDDTETYLIFRVGAKSSVGFWYLFIPMADDSVEQELHNDTPKIKRMNSHGRERRRFCDFELWFGLLTPLQT
jgi:hypothetical protein